jgi:hypothetical protein
LKAVPLNIYANEPASTLENSPYFPLLKGNSLENSSLTTASSAIFSSQHAGSSMKKTEQLRPALTILLPQN